jgi:hypothetical protein
MALSQKLALAALTISLVSVLISFTSAGIAFTSLWRTHLARFKPSVVAGLIRHRMCAFKSEGSQWYISSFDLPLTVVNEGARSGQVRGLRLRLSYPRLPIPNNYELVEATFELPPQEASMISQNRLEWLQKATVTRWMPFIVLPRASVTKHVIFDARWEAPVVQKEVEIELQMLTERSQDWMPVADYKHCLAESFVAAMIDGSSFAVNPTTAQKPEASPHPPDLHKYICSNEKTLKRIPWSPSYVVKPETEENPDPEEKPREDKKGL